STGAEVATSCINDNCPNDPNKTEPGICGCGIPDDDTDMDGFYVCEDCDDNNPNINPGASHQLSNVIYHNPNSVTVYWNTIPGSSNYAIRHRELDSNGAWAEGTSLRSYRRLYSLAACTSYEVQFRNFKNGVWNCWSESDYFTTSGCAKAYSPRATKGASMQGMQIFPNPASDILNVVFDENLLNKAVILTLRDQLGRTVWNRNIQNLETTLIELNLLEYNLPGGVYMLSLQNDGSIITQQVVVSR